MTKSTTLWLLLAITTSANSAELLPPVKVATITPWPAITRLVNYQNKIWFVHSNPYKDTNIANITSYDPQADATRFERSLFSQDSGKPVIHNDLLYWPYEDSRRSAGAGEYAVTNGTDWRWQVMQSGNAMHVHALATCNNQLVAVTGSWTGQFLSQQDNTTWELKQEYPSGKARFSRLVDVLEYNGDCFFSASSNNDPKVKLLRSSDNGILPVKQWPASDRVDGLTVHNNKLYAWADNENGRTLHVYNGTDVQTLSIEQGHRVRNLFSNGETLYVVSSNDTGGALWTVNNSEQLVPVSKLPFTPLSLTTDNAGHLYIGSFNREGAELWKLENSKPAEQNLSQLTAALDTNTSGEIQEEEISTLYEALRSIITDTSNGEDNARALRAALARPEQLSNPQFGSVLTRLLQVPLPDTTVPMFNGRQVVWADMVHWYLLTGLAINGHGSIDSNLLSKPWTKAETRSSKYFDPTIAAIIASGWLKQSDKKTIDALVTRLNTQENDPVWLKTDIAGALTAITGERFGIDADAWVQWHSSRR